MPSLSPVCVTSIGNSPVAIAPPPQNKRPSMSSTIDGCDSSSSSNNSYSETVQQSCESPRKKWAFEGKRDLPLEGCLEKSINVTPATIRTYYSQSPTTHTASPNKKAKATTTASKAKAKPKAKEVPKCRMIELSAQPPNPFVDIVFGLDDYEKATQQYPGVQAFKNLVDQDFMDQFRLQRTTEKKAILIRRLIINRLLQDNKDVRFVIGKVRDDDHHDYGKTTSEGNTSGKNGDHDSNNMIWKSLPEQHAAIAGIQLVKQVMAERMIDFRAPPPPKLVLSKSNEERVEGLSHLKKGESEKAIEYIIVPPFPSTTTATTTRSDTATRSKKKKKQQQQQQQQKVSWHYTKSSGGHFQSRSATPTAMTEALGRMEIEDEQKWRTMDDSAPRLLAPPPPPPPPFASPFSSPTKSMNQEQITMYCDVASTAAGESFDADCSFAALERNNMSGVVLMSNNEDEGDDQLHDESPAEGLMDESFASILLRAIEFDEESSHHNHHLLPLEAEVGHTRTDSRDESFMSFSSDDPLQPFPVTALGRLSSCVSNGRYSQMDEDDELIASYLLSAFVDEDSQNHNDSYDKDGNNGSDIVSTS